MTDKPPVRSSRNEKAGKTSGKSTPKHSAPKTPKTPKTPRTPIEPRIRQRKIKVARDAGRRRLHIVVGVLAVVGLFVGIIALLHSSLFSARHIAVTGLTHTSKAQVLSAAGLESGPALINVNPTADEQAIERLPWIKSAIVHRSWPSTVRITVTERRPVAQAARPHGYAVIDATGRVLDDVVAPERHLVSVVDLSSLPSPGGYLRASDQAIVKTAAATPVSLVNEISYVGSTKKNGIVLGLKGGPVVIFSTDADLRQKMVSLATVLAPSSKVSLSGIVTINLRVPSSPVLTR